MELHRVSGEKRAAVAANKPAGVECQPNAAAPLLRDEKARREWVEHELDMCCQVSLQPPAMTCLPRAVCKERTWVALTTVTESLVCGVTSSAAW